MIKAGTTVAVCFASAMRDPRRVADPETFDPDRAAEAYMHFGFGLHRCFGEAINRAVLPAMLQCLLKRGIRRAPMPEGWLVKRGIFADRLWVEF
jgi:cytochrome P450